MSASFRFLSLKYYSGPAQSTRTKKKPQGGGELPRALFPLRALVDHDATHDCSENLQVLVEEKKVTVLPDI